MKKKLFLFALVLFTAINSYGQIDFSISSIDEETEYDCVFSRIDRTETDRTFAKKGGISANGEKLYSVIYYENTNKYFADDGFGFCEIMDNEMNTVRFPSYERSAYGNYPTGRYYYGLMHSANQNLILVRFKAGKTIKVANLGKYKSVIDVKVIGGSNTYGSNVTIYATTTSGGTSKINFSTVGLDELEEIDFIVDVSSVTLNQSSVTIAKGATAQLEATILPEIATNKELEWTTSDANIATVADGLVTGVNAGMAIISAKATDGSNVMAQCIVVVQDANGISDARIINNVEGVYTVDGKKVTTFSKGIYVVRMNDGTSKTISIK